MCSYTVKIHQKGMCLASSVCSRKRPAEHSRLSRHKNTPTFQREKHHYAWAAVPLAKGKEHESDTHFDAAKILLGTCDWNVGEPPEIKGLRS